MKQVMDLFSLPPPIPPAQQCFPSKCRPSIAGFHVRIDCDNTASMPDGVYLVNRSWDRSLVSPVSRITTPAPRPPHCALPCLSARARACPPALDCLCSLLSVCLHVCGARPRPPPTQLGQLLQHRGGGRLGPLQRRHLRARGTKTPNYINNFIAKLYPYYNLVNSDLFNAIICVPSAPIPSYIHFL
jgi:hypothetical protein